MKKIRWGVLSTARIGTETVIPAMQLGEYCAVTAIASRKLEKAQAAARRLGIGKAYGSYEELLADPDVDAVYIPLPNHLHVPWSIKALKAGKHVLCEKPIGLSAVEAQELLDAAKKFPRLKVMEAFMYRHHPQWQWAKQLVAEGKIGEVRTIQSFFSYYNTDPDNIRNRADIGGGGLMDIGCYCISLSRFIFGAEPRRVCGVMEHDPELKVDRLTSGLLEFGNGTSTFTCATQLAPYQRVNIFGTKGRIEIEIPFNAPSDRPCKVWYEEDGANIEEVALEICNQYTIQGDLFSQAVLEDRAAPVPLGDAVANMRVIEALVCSAKSGSWAHVETSSAAQKRLTKMKRRKRMQFWGEDEDDDSLVREVIRGEKTATVCKADEYDLPDGDYDDGGLQVGELVEVYDLRRKLRCIVKITEVYNVRFGDIPEKLWRAEACRSAEHFREAHHHCWPHYDLTPDFEMTATHFELVEVVNP